MSARKPDTRVSEDLLLDLYLEMRKLEPKSEDMSESLYLMCLTLQMLEKSGNKFPTQEEIDHLESTLKRFNRRKAVKLSIKKKLALHKSEEVLQRAA